MNNEVLLNIVCMTFLWYVHWFVSTFLSSHFFDKTSELMNGE